MTNNRQFFHPKESETDIPVIEGRMVQQFRFGAKAYISGSGRSAKWIPCCGLTKPQFYISNGDINAHLEERISNARIGYCDIAGQTNERAMMSCIIPSNVVCGNKVPTIVFSGDVGQDLMHYWVGVTNSFVFDWILRRVLSTTVNYFLLFSLPLSVLLYLERSWKVMPLYWCKLNRATGSSFRYNVKRQSNIIPRRKNHGSTQYYIESGRNTTTT